MHGLGQFSHGERRFRKLSQNSPPAGRLSPEHVAERLVELAEERSARQEAQLPHVLLHRPFRTDFLKILGDAARDRQDIKQLTRRKPPPGMTEHGHAFRKRQLADIKIERIPSHESGAVKNVFGDP